MPVTSNFLRFCSWNIEGLSRKINDSDFISTIGKFDFVSLVETWLSYDNSDLNIDGFTHSQNVEKCQIMDSETQAE